MWIFERSQHVFSVEQTIEPGGIGTTAIRRDNIARSIGRKHRWANGVGFQSVGALNRPTGQEHKIVMKTPANWNREGNLLGKIFNPHEGKKTVGSKTAIRRRVKVPCLLTSFPGDELIDKRVGVNNRDSGLVHVSEIEGRISKQN